MSQINVRLVRQQAETLHSFEELKQVAEADPMLQLIAEAAQEFIPVNSDLIAAHQQYIELRREAGEQKAQKDLLTEAISWAVARIHYVEELISKLPAQQDAIRAAYSQDGGTKGEHVQSLFNDFNVAATKSLVANDGDFMKKMQGFGWTGEQDPITFLRGELETRANKMIELYKEADELAETFGFKKPVKK